MLCLGGFELYSRWVPLSIFLLCRREIVMILLLLTESACRSTWYEVQHWGESSLCTSFSWKSIQYELSTWYTNNLNGSPEDLGANLLFLGILQSPRGCNFEINYWKSFCFSYIGFCLVRVNLFFCCKLFTGNLLAKG